MTSLSEFTEATQQWLDLDFQYQTIKRKLEKQSETMLAYLEEQQLAGYDVQIRHFRYRVHKVQQQTVTFEPQAIIEAAGVTEAANIMKVSPGPCRDLIELLRKKGRTEAVDMVEATMEVKDKAPYVKVSVIRE